MIIVSTGFKYQLLGGTAFQDMFHNSVILLYATARPESPNDAPNGSPIARITKNGAPFSFGSPAGGLNWSLGTNGVVLPTTQDWIITATGAGTLTWGRLCQNNDNEDASVSLARLDFEVNPTDGYGMSITNPVMAVDDQRTVDFALYAIPPL